MTHFYSSVNSSNLQTRLERLDTKNCACATCAAHTCPFSTLTADWQTISEAKWDSQRVWLLLCTEYLNADASGLS